MKVFLSWSGERSNQVADSLRSWLPKVLQAVKPWMSEEDISSGTRWSAEIANELKESKVGIICITPENQHNPWIMFEAGALSKTLSETFVCPYLHNITPGQLSGPMSQFQANVASREGTFKIVQTLNKALDTPNRIGSELEEIFEVWWPKLEEKLLKIPDTPKEKMQTRSAEDLLEEVLNNTREQLRREEVRLKSFEKRDKDMDSMVKSMETFFEFSRQATLNLTDSKQKFEKLLDNSKKDKDKLNQSKKLGDIIGTKELDVLTNTLSNPDGVMAEMLKSVKSIQSGSQEMTNQLLNPECKDTPED